MISIHLSVFLVQAINAIDADIAQQLLLRKKHIDGVESFFSDSTILSQNSVSLIPELIVVESSDAVMKVRYVEPDPAGFQKQVS